MPTPALAPSLSPTGRLLAVPDPEATPLDAAVARDLAQSFEGGAGTGLLWLGGPGLQAALPVPWSWWRDLAKAYVAARCTLPEGGGRAPLPPPAELDLRVEGAPPMAGAEYLSADVLQDLWRALDLALLAQVDHRGPARGGVPEALRALNEAWHVVGRVHLNLAENRRDPDRPFAFLATYTTRISAGGRPQHLPLGQALREFAGAARKDQLLSLLLPVQRASEGCPWLGEMVQSNEIFHPIRWSPAEAFRFLEDVPLLEQAGVVVRMPATWPRGRPARPAVTATVGQRGPSTLGMASLLDFDLSVSMGDDPLTDEEITALLEGTRGLALLRGQWVEIDPERLRRTLDRFERVHQVAREEGLAFGEAMRLVAGAGIAEEEADAEWGGVRAGPWLAETLAALRSPEGLLGGDPGAGIRGTLRPYQETGVRWLQQLVGLGLGACLADDMGLGKTIQVLALLQWRKRGRDLHRPSLLVAPASLLTNWAAEISRFAPDLRALIAHSSALPADRLRALGALDLAETDLVLTTYASLLRMPHLGKVPWDLVVLDEAQAIKNPSAKQTRTVKKLPSQARVALTGTPVENRPGDLWSLFDFINPGLLGTARQFTDYTRRLQQDSGPGYAPLRRLVGPYILRRLKTDRRVISDLPDKTEVKSYCSLSRSQAALYQQAVDELAQSLREKDGIERRGLVLAFLTRFKQLCNHPSQWLGDGAWGPNDSGKWQRLREVGEVIASRQEKVLVFTQFRAIIDPLQAWLGQIFGRPGVVLHGGTTVKARRERVARFQEDPNVPFFVLSIKAGGSGLNLTAAAHVVHFDRWWNPAVEDQATDRAYRIGQHQNVLVHKFVTRGTVEERVDALIESKKQLSRDLLEGSAEISITELSDAALLELVALDIHSATSD